MSTSSNNGDAAATRLLRTVVWSLVVVVTGATVISILVPAEKQGAALA